jgi:quercetin dioxygenase-like cupin family protein
MKTVTVLALVLGFAGGLHAAETPVVSATPVWTTRTTASGQPITVPAHPEVVVSRLEIAPNSALPLHEHPYPRYAYVLSGTLEVAVSGGKTSRYKAGDFIVEVIGQCHMGRSVGDSPVELLVIDQVAPGRSNTVACSEGGIPLGR